MYRRSYAVTWEQLQRDCRALAWRLADMGQWRRILAITRGGLVPAAIIARELDIHYVDTVCVSSYTMKERAELAVIKKPELYGNESDCLIVDDLVDTGRTAKVVREMFKEAHFASVYAKPEGRGIVDTYMTEVSQDTWILFPWDSSASPQFCPPVVEPQK